MMELFAELDPESRAALARMMNPGLLDPALINMLTQTAEDMQEVATEYMYATFMNPGSGVENAWEIVVTSAELVTLTNIAPYARRLNEGFSQMTDSANRYFEAWPSIAPQGYHWAEYAVGKVAPSVEEYFKVGFEKVIGVG